LGSQTYTFETVFSDTQDYVLIGADTDGSLNNLIAAITNGAGEGTVYGTGTTANASAGAYLHHTAFMKVYALTAGSAGNSIACTDTCANADWIWEGGGSTSTLAGGADEAVTEEVQANDTGEQASRGLWETVVEAPDVFSSTIAQALADAYLVQRVAQPRTVEYKTRLSGLRPGQTQTVTLSTRDLSGTWLITEIRTLGTSGTFIWRTVKAIEGTTFVKDWRQVYQQWGGVS
jgi:hypothetical protein